MKAWICSMLLFSLVPGFAELPFMENGDWRGYYAVHEAQRYTLSLRNDGEMYLTPLKRDKSLVAQANRIKLEFGIEELQEDGSTVFKQTRRDSYQSENEPTEKLRKMVFQATTTGDAVYEVTLEQTRDIISMGGRIIDPGKLTKLPLRFVIRAYVPNVYRRVELFGRDDERAFDKISRRDYMELVRIDHGKQQLTNDDKEVVDGEQLTGSGVEEIEMRLSYYDGRRFYFNATQGSGMAIAQGRTPGPWYEGVTLHWTHDPVQDPEAKSRFSFYVK